MNQAKNTQYKIRNDIRENVCNLLKAVNNFMQCPKTHEANIYQLKIFKILDFV